MWSRTLPLREQPGAYTDVPLKHRDGRVDGGRVYHLFARVRYRAIAKEHIRAGHRHSPECIRTRLAALEFVPLDLQPHYLETEKEKFEFFYLNYGIEATHLPKKVYKGHANSPNTTRYFVDKFPMFLTQDSGSYEPVVTFSFVDPGRSVQSPLSPI